MVLTPSQGTTDGRIRSLLETWALQTGENSMLGLSNKLVNKGRKPGSLGGKSLVGGLDPREGRLPAINVGSQMGVKSWLDAFWHC